MKKTKSQLCWFFTNRQLLIIVGVFCLGIIFQIANVAVNLQFLSAQKAVQNGNLTEWNMYLITLLILSVFSILQILYITVFNSILKRYVHFNLFERYRRFCRVHEKGVFMRLNVIMAELKMPLSIVTAIMGVYTIIRTMEMVTFTVQNILVAILLLVSAMICGVFRGRYESAKKKIDTMTNEKKNDLVKFDSFSTFYLNRALHVIDIEYKVSAKESVKKVFFENLPRLLKQTLYVLLVCGLVKTLATHEVYSESYLLLTAFGTILSIAEEIGSIVEKTVEIVQMKKNSDLKALESFERKEKSQIMLNRECVSLSEKGLEINHLFSLDVKAANGEERRYELAEPIMIPKGNHAILIGEKESGKTRLLSFFETLFPERVMIYNDNSKIFNQFYDNFKSEYTFDYSLIKELAVGLKLERFVNLSEQELKSLQITNINTGDKHLCVALVMLYYAIKNPQSAELIVLDELFANVDKVNSESIIRFIMGKVEEIGATVIFVGHSQQDLIKRYCSSIINLEPNRYEVKVTQTQI